MWSFFTSIFIFLTSFRGACTCCPYCPTTGTNHELDLFCASSLFYYYYTIWHNYAFGSRPPNQNQWQTGKRLQSSLACSVCLQWSLLWFYIMLWDEFKCHTCDQQSPYLANVSLCLVLLFLPVKHFPCTVLPLSSPFAPIFRLVFMSIAFYLLLKPCAFFLSWGGYGMFGTEHFLMWVMQMRQFFRITACLGCPKWLKRLKYPESHYCILSFSLSCKSSFDLCNSAPSLLHYILPLFYKWFVSDKLSLSFMKTVHYMCLFFIIVYKNVLELLSNTILSVWDCMIVLTMKEVWLRNI